MAQTVRNPPVKQETWVWIPGSGSSPEEGNGNPLQYSSLGNLMERGSWWATGCGWQRLNNFIIANFSPPLPEHYAKEVAICFLSFTICLTTFLATKPKTRAKPQCNQELNLINKESNFSLKELQALGNIYQKEQGKCTCMQIFEMLNQRE